MKHLVFVAATAVLAVVSLAVAFRYFLPDANQTILRSQGPTVERLEQLSHLVTMRVYIADVLTAEGDGHRGAWPRPRPKPFSAASTRRWVGR